MSCFATKNCKRAVQEIPDCSNGGSITFYDTGLTDTTITLRIEKANGSLLDISLNTTVTNSLVFTPDTDLPADYENWLNEDSGLVCFTVLDFNLGPQTITDENGETAECVLVRFVPGDGTWTGNATLEFNT